MSLEKFIKEKQGAFDDKKMPDSARAAFEKQLQNELHSKPKVHSLWPKYIAAAAFFGILISVGYFYERPKNIKQDQSNELLVAFDKATASERLEAVYSYEEQYKEEDTRYFKALFKLLHQDDNNNVKIAAIDALVKFPENEYIRLELIKALEKEKEPLVQIKLISSITFLKEKRAKKALEDIIEDRESFPEVKGNAALAMVKLEN